MALGDSASDDFTSPAESTLVSSVATATLASDISHPSISMQSVKEMSWGTAALLDKISNNYAAWSRRVIRILRLSSGLDLYLNTIQSFLIMKCADSEHPFIENCASSHEIWSILQQRHIHQGPMSQVTLIQEALSVHYSSSVPFANTTLILRDLNRRIWDMGAPNSEGFLCILMLLALSADNSLSSVRDTIVSGLSSSTTDRAYTSAEIVARLDFEQQARSMHTVPVPAEAHVAHGAGTSDSKQSICSNCKKPRHTVEFCIQPGGGMAGKSIAEGQQARDAKRGKRSNDKSKNVSKPAGSIIQSGHQAFIVDADGKAHRQLIWILVSLKPGSTAVHRVP
ncbi:hypothetical protein K443DRAFT_4660 [Laccaria amethystina LaAM-08-1]|uniref:Uncharacterized protein n=1 Tax=Laccaria amethystina LaAM-08-1 TaxID=1095629 RepID=A0A0C9Y2N3_9AGAR|nr:hypothetical protein K443DRAFT_4660 [Laccaria amethystina LaAM-08-1]